MKSSHRLWWALPVMFGLHVFLSLHLLALWWSPPVLLVEMSTTAESVAQVYYDKGSGINEANSSKVAVLPQYGPQELRLPLPNAEIEALRFDPLNSPGEVVIYRAVVLRSNGSVAASFPPSRIHEIQQFDRREVVPGGLRLHVSPGAIDPQLRLDLESPLDLRQRFRGFAGLLRVALWNIPLLLAEIFLLIGLPWGIRIIRALPRPGLRTFALLTVHALLTAVLLSLWSSPPVLMVEMSSSVMSRAEVYWDMGAGMSEEKSSSEPVRAGNTPQLLQFPLPYGWLKGLRFDPLTCPGTIVIRRAAILRSDGSTALLIDSSRIRGKTGFDQMEFEPAGLRFHIRSDSYDPQLDVDLGFPIDLRSHSAGNAVWARIALVNALLLAMELLLLVWPPGRTRTIAAAKTMNAATGMAAARLSSPHFIMFDGLAIWFYIFCIAVFAIFAAADLNGSSLGVLWTNYKVGSPPKVLAGMPQQIRADEFNYQTPAMLNQYFRLDRFQVTETPLGGDSVGLLAELPVRHWSTWLRPQFWPFFALPADYAFAAWWQAKWLIMATGAFTLLLLITGSSGLAIAGTLWLSFSQFTQWCFSWPSMLPEMAGLICFTVVFFLYLCVGAQRLALAASALLCAACAVNFALAAYVPHLIPYAWVGIIMVAAWLIAHRADILRREGLALRIGALVGCAAVTGICLFAILQDVRAAVQGIAATNYPGHRSMSGGGYSLTTLATHFLAGAENGARFPPEYSNICEAAGFLWLAPATLFALARMRSLTVERRILLAGLWAAALLLTAWMVLPIPAAAGHFLFLDRVQGLRMAPALGLVNICIVMLVLSAPQQRRRMELTTIFTIAAPVVFTILFLANQEVNEYFRLSELLLGTLWASVMITLLLDGRRLAFAAAVVIPNVFLFALVNPVGRGLDTITSTPLFDLVQQNARLRQGKWLVFSKGYPTSIFTAVGCDVYNGMRYLPDLDHFPLFAAHGIDTGVLNNLGYMNIAQLEPGEAPRATLGKYGPILSVSPLDPLVKELGIRYVAFHDRPAERVLKHLKPLINGNVSEFWLYELQ